MAETLDTKDNFDIVVLNFADSKIPEFKEVRNKDWILYGEDNKYPDYLTMLYNKSAKHNAIVNGKCNYILGSGFEKKVPMAGGFAPYKAEDGTEQSGCVINRSGETMFDVMQKSIKDIEIYGGYRWAILWNAIKKVAEIYHVDFYKIRTGKEGGFFYKEKWSDAREQAIFYAEFDPANPVGTQIFAYNEYRPGCDYYPLPGYVGCCNYIDIDIEISKFHLSAIRNGMMPSKMIQFYTGEPSDDKKKEIERRFGKKFAGSENAGKFILVFNNSKDKTVDVQDLSFNELDKQFDILNKTSQQEIFTGHQVVSPMLFGIKTEGQLGGNTELKTAYEIFINTYAKPKQANLEKIVNYFGGLMGKGSDYYISQLDPVGLVVDVKDVLSDLPKEFIYDKLNIPKEFRQAPAAIAPGVTTEQQSVNDNIKNLTGRQYQQLMRIIRQFSRGQITQEQATVLLKTGLGLNDDDIAVMLGIGADDEPTGFAKEYTEEDVADMFSEVGDSKESYHIVKTKAVKYTSDKEVVEDELNFFSQAFKTEVSNVEASILDLIAKDKRITPEVIAQTIGSTPEYVTAKIGSLIERGIIETTTQQVGDDTQIERKVLRPMSDIKPPDGKPETTEILVRYSYEVKPNVGPAIIATTRPFCKKLLALDRLYSRTEIESISQRLGYSVWDRKGGWWGKKPECRHRWVSHIVVRKGGKK